MSRDPPATAGNQVQARAQSRESLAEAKRKRCEKAARIQEAGDFAANGDTRSAVAGAAEARRARRVLTNSNAADATLTATLFDYFPARMMLYETGSTTCQGGPGLLQNGRMVALQAGAIIPASGSCTISVKVVSQVVGDLVNTIPAGGLVTDAGSSATDASATLTATAP